jgi:hypothetical protein
MTLTTTLNRLKAAGVRADRYEHLVKALGGVSFDHDEPIKLLTILEHSGIADVEWLLESTAPVEDPAPALAEYERVKAQALAEILARARIVDNKGAQ